MELDSILNGSSVTDSPNKEKPKKSRKKSNNNSVNLSQTINNNAVLTIEIVTSIIQDFTKNTIFLDDPAKMSGGQWRSCCMLIGQYIKNNRLIVDEEKSKKQGGVIFSVDKLDITINLFEYSCGLVKKSPLISDFLKFACVSETWLYNTNGHCLLTSAGGDIRKKLADMQSAGIASGVVNDRENPTGKIYFSKAILGWSENGSRLPASDNIGENNAALPDLSSYLLTDGKKQ